MWIGPGDVGAFGVDEEVAADEPCGEAQRKLLADFAVGVGHHMVRVGVDADEA